MKLLNNAQRNKSPCHPDAKEFRNKLRNDEAEPRRGARNARVILSEANN